MMEYPTEWTIVSPEDEEPRETDVDASRNHEEDAEVFDARLAARAAD